LLCKDIKKSLEIITNIEKEELSSTGDNQVSISSL